MTGDLGFGMEKRVNTPPPIGGPSIFRKFVQEKAIDCRLESLPTAYFAKERSSSSKGVGGGDKLGIPNALLPSWG